MRSTVLVGGGRSPLSLYPVMRARLQKHDLTAEEFDALDSSAVKRMLHSFDWASECERQAKSGGETCDPGFGLVVGDGHILHICPGANGACRVHFHFPTKRKFLGLIPKTVQQSRMWETVSLQEADRMIDRMFLGEFDALKIRV